MARKWNIEDYQTDMYRVGETVKQTLERYYSSIGDVITIRILDEYVSTAGLGFAIIELCDGRIGEAFILKRSDGIQSFYVIADRLCARVWKDLHNTSLDADCFEKDI